MTHSPTNEPKTAEQIAAFFLGDCVCSKSSEQPCRTTMLATKIKARAQQECRELVEALTPFAKHYDELTEQIRIAMEERPEITANEVLILQNRRAGFYQAKTALDSWKARNQ